MEKKVIEAIIERAEDGTYDVYCIKEMFSGVGTSVEEAKADMMTQMELFKTTAKEEGLRYPGFLDGEFEISYTYDIKSILVYYVKNGILSLSGLEKITGINQKQLWAYLNGTTPRKAQAERIERGLNNFAKDINAIFA